MALATELLRILRTPGYDLGHPRHVDQVAIDFSELTLIAGKVLVALSTELVGQPYETLIAEYMALPLTDFVTDKWPYGNAARVRRLRSGAARPVRDARTDPAVLEDQRRTRLDGRCSGATRAQARSGRPACFFAPARIRSDDP